MLPDRTSLFDNRRKLIVVLGIPVFLIGICLVCVFGSIQLAKSVFPSNEATRTALDLLFDTDLPPGTIQPGRSTEPISPIDMSGVQQTTSIPPGRTEIPNTPTFAPPIWVNPPAGQIVYTCYINGLDQICLLNADGSGNQVLTDFSATSFYPSLTFDGTGALFVSRQDGNFEIYRLELSTGKIVQLSDDIGNLYAPELSPNGNRLIFTRESGGKQTIWIMKADGSNARPLEADDLNGIDPTWSPDGEQVAFASDRSGTTRLYTINANGQNLRQVNTGVSGIGGRSDWSPDGAKLIFYAGPPGQREIYSVNLDGSGLNQLTEGGDNLGPCYSPDGNWIAFTSYRDGNNEIYIMRNDGSQETRLTGFPRADWQPRWGLK